jgi:hypothetical protein
MIGTVIATTVGCLCAIGIAVWCFRRKGKPVDEQVQGVMEAVAPAPKVKPPEEQASEALDGLLKVNTFVRVTDGIPQKVLELVEKQIDDLMAAVPKMIEKHPDLNLTFNLRRISVSHLSELLKEHFDMEPANIKKYMPNLIERLEEIGGVISRAKECAEHNEVAEMKVISGTLQTMFSKKIGEETL